MKFPMWHFKDFTAPVVPHLKSVYSLAEYVILSSFNNYRDCCGVKIWCLGALRLWGLWGCCWFGLFLLLGGHCEKLTGELRGGLAEQGDPAHCSWRWPIRGWVPLSTVHRCHLHPHLPSTPSYTANNRGRTIKGYAFVLLFKTKTVVC